MIELREYLGLALKPCHPLGILCQGVRQNLDRAVAVQLGISGAPDFAHPTFTDLRR